MRYILGVDGGGSKTYAVVVDQLGNKVGSGVAGCGNHQGPGIEVALRNIVEASDQALNEAGLSREDIDYASFGLAGADREKDFNILRPALATLSYKDWDVVCDTLEGLRTGSADNVGVVLVCGSGTNAMGRNSKGEVVQTGGFGYLFGDTAGGSWMAAETFRAAVRSWEFREEPSILTELVPSALGFQDMETVFNHWLDEDLWNVPQNLTVVLHKAAAEGDGLAIRLLKTTGRELGLAANSVIRRLGGFGNASIPIVLVGSVLQKGKSPHLLQALSDTIEKQNKDFQILIPEMAPVYGAVLLGMDHLSIETGEDIGQKFVSYGGYEQ